MSKTRYFIAAAALAACAVLPAQAALVKIAMQGANFAYFETGFTCDTGGGVDCLTTADPLMSAQFTVDGVLVGSLASGISFNLLLFSPPTNPTVNGSHGLLPAPDDVIDFEIGGAPGLFTDVIGGNVTFGGNGTTYSASGTSAIFASSLPFGLVAGGPISWALAGTGACTGQAGSRICLYSGTAELSWNTAVPEPASALLVGAALLGAAACRRRAA
jgi:hypothetical protein